MSDYRDYAWYERIFNVLTETRDLLMEIRDRLPPPKPVGYQNQNQCLQCGTMFIAGAGTGRRLNAVFCSDEHRVLYNSLKRSPKARQREKDGAEA